MANEMIAMPSVTSTLTQHGGLQAAMSASSSVSVADGYDVVEQKGVESAAKASQEPLAHIRAAEPSIDKAYIEKQAQELQERLDNLSKMKGWTINFSLVPELEQPVIKVIDVDTKQVIRQIPSEEMLLMNKRLQAMEQAGNNLPSLSGLLFDGLV
ncbi:MULTISPECIES: flagellar protein FlaG [Aeromonas]|jgi:flagellar protein FlaG|uniref:FlaG n=1 Tax=Aeromonas caviae TaxID=648 RepID=Q9R9R7_AERCA|nr:flagellar protein FlaG [Aeromonas caviae]AAF19181.1 FlaG [Aeromonas caviae]MCY9812448.1 flagellar protein FlaG [Aeromonas caviae]MDX7786090.1 flagellar protein FlaG [Aeromonas caviae]MDX7852798.1 flagellar protein FlaG [Aeromonas caviae]